jgi:serine/threonine protein kinase
MVVTETKLIIKEKFSFYEGKYLGYKVVIQKIEEASQMSRDHIQYLLDNLQKYKNYRHQSIIRYLACCYEPLHLAIILNTDTISPTLFDVLQNPDIHISQDETLEIAIQIVKSLNWLHMNKIYHLGLSSSCIIAKNFNQIKVFNFGLYGSIFGLQSDRIYQPEYVSPEALWTGIIRYPDVYDVYSFGILLYEIVTRSIVYENLNAMQIGMNVCVNKLRPEIPVFIPEPLATLMSACWNENKSERPNLNEIIRHLNMIKHRKI